jgi:hypothetical protein
MSLQISTGRMIQILYCLIGFSFVLFVPFCGYFKLLGRRRLERPAL